MSDGCEKCGLEDNECLCYVYGLEERIEKLEDIEKNLLKVINLLIDMVQRLQNGN